MTSETALTNWVGTTHETGEEPKIVDGPGVSASLNEPNGCWARTSADGQSFLGLYIADTGNDCIRFASPDGRVETLLLQGVPDVRLTSSDCIGGQCTDGVDFAFGLGDSDDEEEKKDE